MKEVFFVGSYTEFPIPGFGGIGKGVYTVQLDTNTGRLDCLHIKETRNPSYLATSDKNDFLYLVTELDQSDNPKVQGYRILVDGSLEFVNEQPIPGGFPCHICYAHGSVVVSCYASGNLMQYSIGEGGKLMADPLIFQHEGSSIDLSRQEGPHAHQFVVHPNKKDALVSDLGIDQLKAYRFENSKLTKNLAGDSFVTKGGGPRHMVFDQKGENLYLINELTGKVGVLKESSGSWKEIGLYDSLPETYELKPSSSAIRLHPDGKYLYVANRTIDLLTIFKVRNGELELIGYQYTKGKEIREFNITPDGRWLIACHQDSHDMVVYKIKSDGTLDERFRTREIFSPVCVTFFNKL